MDFLTELKDHLVREFPRVRLEENEYWIAIDIGPAACWLRLVIDEKVIWHEIVDHALENKRITGEQIAYLDNEWIPLFSPYALTPRMLIDWIKSIVSAAKNLDLNFGSSENFSRWILTKMTLASGVDFFAYLEMLDTEDGMLMNLVWAIARLKGEEYLRVLRNMKAGAELL